MLNWRELENQTFVSKPVGKQVMFVDAVKRVDDKVLYCATIIDYGDLTITRATDKEVNELWFDEWWCVVRYKGAWEQEIDNFAEQLKETAELCHNKHEGNITKDKEFFQSIIGNTYKSPSSQYYILVRGLSSEQPNEFCRRYELEVSIIDCEIGEIWDGKSVFGYDQFRIIYKSCEYEEFVGAIEKISKSKVNKYNKIREKCLASRRKIEATT